MASNNRNMENRIKIPFIDTLASTKGIKNINMRFPNSNRKRGASQTWRKQYAIHAQTDVAVTQWTGAGEWLAQIIRRRKRKMYRVGISKKDTEEVIPLEYESIKDAFITIENLFFGDYKTSCRCTIEIVDEENSHDVD